MNNNYCTIDKKTFQGFAELIYDHAGICLGPHKMALLSSRMGKRMRILGIVDFQDYLNYVCLDKSQGELVKLLDAISTNVTGFFREPRHFEVLGKIIKGWENKGQKKFRLWCAASSSGEEPYNMAIIMAETLKDLKDVKILATDISTNILEKARMGVYGKKRLQNVPAWMIERYFSRTGQAGGEQLYQVSDRIKSIIQFGRLNLADTPFPLRGPLDVIFTRNVMIYFDNKVRKRLLDEMYRLLKPGGYLMVGHAESLSGMLSNFKTVEPSVYIK